MKGLMHFSWLLLALIFAATCPCLAKTLLRGVPISWLTLEAQPLCTLPASSGFSGPVQVFVHQDNTRHLEFGDEWSGTQTSVSCTGPVPDSCLAHFQEDASSPVPNCNAIQCPCDRDVANVSTEYLAKMVEVVVPMCKKSSSSRDFHILNIGLGGGDVPAYLLAHCPTSTRIESIEYDPRVVEVASKFFGTSDWRGRHSIDIGDGGAQAAALLKAGHKYDAILVDVFNDAGDVPASCLGDDFAGTIRGLLRPGGKVVQQVWDQQHKSLLASFQKRFGQELDSQVEDLDIRHGQWIVMATRGGSLDGG